ncbi:MAG TPA: hypothetical protein VMY16_11100 [Ilumatobacteraceae bacterium]|nr:hypothetical protein [Ilumatobacteraceae bacterium]
MTGVAGISPSATAVSANFTVTGQDRSGFLTVYDCSTRVPTVSTLNFVLGEPVANQAIVPLDSGGGICLFSPARTHIVIDVNGSFSAGTAGRLTALAPKRLLDTRRDTPVTAGRVRTVRIESSASGVPTSATAAVVNLTAVNSASRGWARLFPCDQGGQSAVSNVNFGRGETRANSAIVKLSNAGTVCVQTNVTVDIVIDITGYMSSSGLQYQALAPVRLIDSRDARVRGQRFPAGSIVQFDVAGLGGIPSSATAASMNLVAVSPTSGGFMTMWPCRNGDDPPLASNVNFRTGRNVANGVTVGLFDQHICLYTIATAHFVVDVSGIWQP